ncbi:MAG: hypothetical protein LBQ51_05530 [Desulfovibrio sp.]|jgi:hypothetical protein|nr:hypothetical protein [Desulfovibrio sp.]
MSGYADFVAQDRRLVILRLLRGIESRRANQYVLRTACKSCGYDELASTIVNDLAFLRREGLVLTEDLPPDILLATLTDLGDQAARGVVRIRGVAVPAVE